MLHVFINICEHIAIENYYFVYYMIYDQFWATLSGSVYFIMSFLPWITMTIVHYHVSVTEVRL